MINSHVFRQGWTQKLSYRGGGGGGNKISKEGGIQVLGAVGVRVEHDGSTCNTYS